MCDCSVCTYAKEFDKQIKDLPIEKQKFFSDLYENHCNLSMDRDYYKCIVMGTWPTSDEILARYRTPKLDLADSTISQMSAILNTEVENPISISEHCPKISEMLASGSGGFLNKDEFPD